MKLDEIFRTPQRGFSHTFDVDAMELDYEGIEDDSPRERNPQAWMPDMRNRPEYAVKFQYEYTPAERGSRERGGLQLEPDYSANAQIDGAQVFDPRVKQWINIDPKDYFSVRQLEKIEQDIMDSLEDSGPDPYDAYRDEDR